MGRWLGLDYGHKRVGVAIADERNKLASPRPPLMRGAAFDQHLQDLIEKEGITNVALGLPLTLKGGESQGAREVREFAQWLINQFKVEVAFIDERFSTKQVERQMIAGDVSRKQRRQQIDSLTATMLLQTFLDGREPSGDDQLVED